LLPVLARFLETVVTLLVLGVHVHNGKHKLQITCNCYSCVNTDTVISKKNQTKQLLMFWLLQHNPLFGKPWTRPNR